MYPSWTVGNLLDGLLHILDISPARNEQYFLKICGSEEFLKNGEIFGNHESAKRFQQQHMEVPLRLLRRDAVNNELARDGSTNMYSRLKCGTNMNQIVEEVQSICSFLSNVSSREVEDGIAEIQRVIPLNPDPSECETRVLELHQALRKLLHTFFSNFESDFGSEEVLPTRPKANVSHHEDVLQLDLAALYRVKSTWLSSFDFFSISCKLTYGSQELCETALSENIATALSLGNKLQCSRMMVFPIQIKKLPYESMLTFRLLGSKKGKSPELLSWAVLPLFSKRQVTLTLVSGTVLLSMSMLPELTALPVPAVSDSHRQATGVILELGFPDTHRWKYDWPNPLPGSILAMPPFEELQQKIRDVSQKHCLLLLTENERSFLWDKRHFCTEDNTYVHLLLGSAPRWAPEDLTEIYTILEHWPLRNPEDALFLLSDCFLDQKIRGVAIQQVQQFSDEELEEYLPQLVQALKLEWELDGPLVLLLLRRSLQSVRVAQQLYWLLEDVLEDIHYRSWYSKVQAALKHCCGRRLRQELENEQRLVKVLTQAANKIRMVEKSRRKEVLNKEKINISNFFKDGISCRLPLDPAVFVDGVDIEACTFYNANSLPLEVSFINADSQGRNTGVICKTGDNLRQDMLVLQIVRVMDRVWLQAGLDMRMVIYREDTLEKWFHMWNRTEEAYEEVLAVVNFLHSCAGWCVATFILGICDRHNDNIMLKHSGHMFHIDFGKIMGNAQTFGTIKRQEVECVPLRFSPRTALCVEVDVVTGVSLPYLLSHRDRCPFIFTSEMQHFITGGGRKPQRFHRFVELCCEAYNGIRKRAALVLSLLQLMLGAGMPEMKDSQDLQYVHNHLRPQDSELEATSYFTRMIEESMNSLPVKINFLIHNMGQLPGRQRLAVEATRVSPRTNIQEAVIQKYTTKGREVIYELKVIIEDGYLISEKTFSQFETIHKALQRLFVESMLPQFPGWYRMSFTPSRRMTLLNKYLKELFNGPCKGNEFVCSLFLDGPRTDMAPKASRKDAVLLTTPQVQLCMTYRDRKLSVLVKHLKNIRLPDGTCPDTYVVTRLRPDPENCSKRKTRVVRNNYHPTFNQLIEYSDVQTLQGKVLELQVKSRKGFLAATSIRLEDGKMGTEKWFLLGNCSI
ncbi:phosphatidylinositol 4-phosphate 3-kinase C2 domain-containing subunit gamma-like [Scleropages formosus]|uniref:Phosphatidylinositol 4-phosphate 3-kinase C2 domain-containing subunit gamma-like n=1 Tax=Scleropages formosus TaxID=113540 RepID=A0A0P7WKP5_SCLFO|nr:phosphatidylinositol 4-phosphate 3-kinase C2 domain-containing subunit gamma-like [Scleropages formosus]